MGRLKNDLEAIEDAEREKEKLGLYDKLQRELAPRPTVRLHYE